jgi:ABC-type glycerol-3-phosphate transport system substrate-binding protein
MKSFCVTSRIVVPAMLFALLCGCNQKPKNEFTILLRMMPAQQRFFRDEIIKPFEQKNDCKINIATFTNQWDIENMLKLEKQKKAGDIGIVKTPFEMTRVLVGNGYMKSLNEIKDSSQVAEVMAEYHQLAAGLGYIDDVPYYIPRKLETQIMYYSKSKVADAVSKFSAYRDVIGKQLKTLNRYGLPAGYILEADPNQWDFYDLFVVGYIWSKEKYNDVTTGRLAHRGAKYEGTALYLVDRALQLGASSNDLLNMTKDKVVDMFVWENVLLKNGFYNPGMWQDPWRGSNLYNGIKDGKIFLTFLQQIDCFIVHGWEDDPAMTTYLPIADDMGLARIPKAVSFAIDSKGRYVYEGTRAISTGGWWWGVPKTCPNPGLAYDFIRYITNKENQAKECSRFGMIPVRKDILNNLPEVFDAGWVGEIFKISIEQIKAQVSDSIIVTVPLVKQYSEIGQNYIDAWYKLCVEYDQEKEGVITSVLMKKKLETDFVTKEKEILGSDYPQ